MKSKTVLILTDYFPPGFAPRMGFLSKYLDDYGWKGVAISPLYDNGEKRFDFLSGYIPYKMIYISKKKEERRFFHKALSFFFPELRVPWGLNKKTKHLVNELIAKERIDIILSSTYNLFPLNIAYKTAKNYKIPWIADLRDICEQYPIKENFLKELFKKIGIQKRNYYLKRANSITTVSTKHTEILTTYSLKAHCIYNGADTDIFAPSKYHNLNKFRIIYTGTISDASLNQDVSPLFSAIRKLYINKEIYHNNCRIQFYSNVGSHKIVNKLKEMFDVSDFVDSFDFVSASEIPKILSEASILLLLLNRGNTGIMTTKFFEYLAVGRPILCIWNDEGAVEEIINSSRAGIAAKTENDIRLFIKSKYDEWLTTGYTHSDIDMDSIKKYSRRNNAKQFVELFDIVLKSKKNTLL